MSIAVLSAGDFSLAFEANADKIRTWQNAKRERSARWTAVEVYNAKPKQEFIGPALASLDFSVRLDIERGVIPRDEIRALNEQMEKGNVLQFTVGSELVGDFVIKKLSEDWKRFSREGVLLTAEIGLSIEEYA